MRAKFVHGAQEQVVMSDGALSTVCVMAPPERATTSATRRASGVSRSSRACSRSRTDGGSPNGSAGHPTQVPPACRTVPLTTSSSSACSAKYGLPNVESCNACTKCSIEDDSTSNRCETHCPSAVGDSGSSRTSRATPRARSERIIVRSEAGSSRSVSFHVATNRMRWRVNCLARK